MSADDRNFHQVGKKLLARVPLAQQLVDPTDSVLGTLSKAPGKGLNTTYTTLIQKAFQPGMVAVLTPHLHRRRRQHGDQYRSGSI